MEFGYGAALALVLTFLLRGGRVALCAPRLERAGAMIERRSRTRRLFEVELPVLLVVLFAVAPYAWMILTSIKPQAELSIWPVQLSTARGDAPALSRPDQPHEFCRKSRQQHGDRVRFRADRSRVSAFRPPTHSRAFGFAGRRQLMTGFLVINMFPIVLLIIPLFLLMRTLGLIDTFARRDPRAFHLRDPVRDLDADELFQRHSQGPRRGGDDRRREPVRRRSASWCCRW